MRSPSCRAVVVAALLALLVTHCHAAPQLAELPAQFTDVRQFAASCRRQPGKGLELEHAVLFKGEIYCAAGADTVGVSSASLPAPTSNRGGIPLLPVVAADHGAYRLARTCTYLPEHVAFIGMTWWPQIGHFMYNTVACLFSVLGVVEAHAAGTDAYAEARASLNDSLQLFMYPDTKLDDRWLTELWRPVLPENAAAAEIFRVFTKHPAMSLPALLHSSTTEAYCFRKLTLGLSGTKLDHHRKKVPQADWVLFRDALTTGLNATPVPRCSRTTTNVVIVQRKKSRKILNVEELAAGVEEMFRASSEFGRGQVQVVAFEEISFTRQAQLMARTDVMIGVDGTGLFNGNFMPTGSYVLRIKPYALDILFPGKSANFKRIWRALGIRDLEWEAKYLNQTVSPMGAEKLQALVDAAQRGEITEITRERSVAALSQDTRVNVIEIQQILKKVLKAVAGRDCVGFR